MAEKATKMLIKVDLQCCRCYKKIKKILCEYPHIRDQIYDEKKNTVTITVVCCSPEKIRDKIICKGGKTVQGVEILPEKPPEEKPKEDKKPSNGSKAKGSGKDPEPTKKPEPEKKPAKQPQPNGSTANGSGPKRTNPDPEPAQKPKEPEKKPAKQPQPPLKTPELASGYLTVPIYLTMCCCPCYGGYGSGPCYCNGQRRPVMCYDGCGRPACVCQGGSRRY